MKKSVYIIIFILLFVGLLYFYNNNYGKTFLEGKDVIVAYDEIIEKQIKTDKKISEYINDKYTLDNAKVIVNPYEISPATALIIFYTKKDLEVKVYINNSLVTTMEKSNNHVIPIYGLKEGNNKVKLVLLDKEKEFNIKVDKYPGNKLSIINTSNKVNDLYLISPNFASNRIYDKDGNLLWYLKGDYAGDIEYINTNTFYISDKFQGVNGVKINYPSFLKMDYLGKIHEEYVTDYGYHHELLPLSNNRMLVLGYEDDSLYLESNVHIMNLKTGKIEKSIDLYNAFANIDKKWADSFKSGFDFVCNSAEYNEETGDFLFSTRGFNSIVMMNLKTEKIKWIFGDPNLYSEAFDNYLLLYDGDYPSGQHTAHLNGNILSIHNNDYNMFNIKKTIGDYKDYYTAAEEYEINGNKIKKVWEYTNDKNEFSKVAGAYEKLSNGNKLITYGWSIEKKDNNNVSLNDENYLNGKIIELDKNDNVVFSAQTKDLIYRTYKVNFYDEKTTDYKISSYKKISSMKTPKSISTASIAKKLTSSIKKDIDFSLYTSRISINNSFNKDDSVIIYLVSENNKTYKYIYKESEKDAPNSINTHINKGLYGLYIDINNKIYDTGKIINFGD